MESAGARRMNRALVSNILSSFADRALTLLAQMVATVILVRLLPRADYGVIGVAAGYAAFMQLINLSLDSAILRDRSAVQEFPERFLASFMCFNLLKAAAMLLFGAGLAAVLSAVYSRPGFSWAILSLTAIAIAESLVAPLAIYASALYRQQLVTRLNVLRHCANVLLLAGLLLQPTLSYLFAKDVAVMLLFLGAWLIAARKVLGLDFSQVRPRRDIQPAYLLRTLTRYSLWVHLVNVATTFIYRADTFFLSFFAPLSVVGNYNVALSSANVANVAPALLGYQNSVALANAGDAREAFRLTDAFLRLSTYVGAVTLLGFALLGIPFLQLATGDSGVINIYGYMLCIVTGLLVVKTVASPLVAYINVKGDVRALFLRVMLPVLCCSALSYYLAARYFGAAGVAASNIVNALIWLSLLLLEMRRYGYRAPHRSGFSDDLRWVRNWWQERARKVARPSQAGR